MNVIGLRINFFVQNLDSAVQWLGKVLNLPEILEMRQDDFRAVQAGPVIIGLNLESASRKLGLPGLRQAPIRIGGTKSFLTINLSSEDEVRLAVERAIAYGGVVTAETAVMPWGEVMATVLTPDDYVVRFGYMPAG